MERCSRNTTSIVVVVVIIVIIVDTIIIIIIIMCNLCITLEGLPPYCVCDCFYFHGKTGGRDSVGTIVFVYNLHPA